MWFLRSLSVRVSSRLRGKLSLSWYAFLWGHRRTDHRDAAPPPQR